MPEDGQKGQRFTNILTVFHLFTVNMNSDSKLAFHFPIWVSFVQKHDVLWHKNKFFSNVARLRKMNTENSKAAGISERRRIYLEINKICPLWPYWEVLASKCEYANNVHILNKLSGFDINKCGLNTHFEWDIYVQSLSTGILDICSRNLCDLWIIILNYSCTIVSYIFLSLLNLSLYIREK